MSKTLAIAATNAAKKAAVQALKLVAIQHATQKK